MTQCATYVFADKETGAGTHAEMAQHLATVLDPFTQRCLALVIRRGMRCLEIGAGAGRLALWLAQQGLKVTATDLEPQHIPDHPNITALRHDIAHDPLDPARSGLTYSRLVLPHRPDREEILAKMVEATEPGGWIADVEFASGGWDRCVLSAPDRREAQRLCDSYHQALTAVMRVAGTDVEWGRDVYAAMGGLGLVDIHVEVGGAQAWRGGTAGCLLPHAMTSQKRDELIDAGMPASDLDQFRQLLLNPDLVLLNSTAIATMGRRP